MKITKKQLRKIIAETVLYENVGKLVQKHASSGKSIDAAVLAALEDAEAQAYEVDEQELAAAMEDYYDEMMGV